MSVTSSIGPRNPALERIRSGDVALGMLVRLGRSGDIARIAATSGHDFIFLDAQHSIFSLETIGHIAQAALGCGITALVRVRSCDDPDTSVLLDNGVSGIVFPDINTAAEAQRAVNSTRFAPIGKRSVTSGYPMYDFRTVPTTESVRSLNDNTMVVCMIETREGLANVDEIAQVEGIDVIHVGCSDLLVSMGKPGAFGDPEIVAAVNRVIDVTAAHGKFAGLGGERDPARQAEFIQRGVRFVTTQSDIAMLMAEATRRTESLRGVSTRSG